MKEGRKGGRKEGRTVLMEGRKEGRERRKDCNDGRKRKEGREEGL